jgi:hypothetical protein
MFMSIFQNKTALLNKLRAFRSKNELEPESRSWSVLKKSGILVSFTQDPSQENAQKHGVTAKFNTKSPTR